MADKLSPDTCEEIRTLCRTISVAHDLDAEIHEELYGHMEDKMLAYLKGEELLTEKDAFILLREHFGDPAAVKGLLQNVHAYEAHLSLVRRLAAVCSATLGFLILQQILFCISFLGFVNWQETLGRSDRATSAYCVLHAALTVASTVLLFLYLIKWQKQLIAGRPMWFIQWRPIAIVSLLGSLLLLQKLVPYVSPGDLLSVDASAGWVVLFALGAYMILGYLGLILQCFTWLWWCDRPPRKAKTVSYAFLAWLALFAWQVSFQGLEFSVVGEELESTAGPLSYMTLVQGNLYDSPLLCALRWEIPSSIRLLVGVQMLVLALLCGYVARGFYRCIVFFHDKRTGPPEEAIHA